MTRFSCGSVSCLALVAFVAFAAFTACGPTQQGFTTCGSATCQPGQYCFGGGICNDGCVSAVNCADGQECKDEQAAEGHGTCVDVDTPTGGEGEGEGEGAPAHDTTCDGYVAFAEECGLLTSEGAAIRQQCDRLSADQQSAMVACAASSSCQELLGCSGLQCFTDSECPAATPHCLLRAEVVDPFNDIPYTCR